MESYRHRLPPLDALLVFEAVVRCGGITRAAAELNVTQAAVSKRVRGLEDHLGVRLLARVGRAVYPTDAGRALNEKVAAALDYLDEACTTARGRPDVDSVSISGDTAVSHYWLGPALQAFGRSHPSISLRLVTSDLTSDQIAVDNDLAVLYCSGERPGWRFAPLFGQELVPAASPDYLAAFRSIGVDDRATLEAAVLLDHDRKEPGWTNWQVWLSETGLADIDCQPERTYNSYALAVGAALEGEGIALASLPLLHKLFESGALRAATTTRSQSTQGFFLGHQVNRALSEPAQLLYDWLIGIASHRRHD